MTQEYAIVNSKIEPHVYRLEKGLPPTEYLRGVSIFDVRFFVRLLRGVHLAISNSPNASVGLPCCAGSAVHTMIFIFYSSTTAPVPAPTSMNLRAVSRGAVPFNAPRSILLLSERSPGAICSDDCPPLKGRLGGDGGSFLGDECAGPGGEFNSISCLFLGGMGCRSVDNPGGGSLSSSGGPNTGGRLKTTLVALGRPLAISTFPLRSYDPGPGSVRRSCSANGRSSPDGEFPRPGGKSRSESCPASRHVLPAAKMFSDLEGM